MYTATGDEMTTFNMHMASLSLSLPCFLQVLQHRFDGLVVSCIGRVLDGLPLGDGHIWIGMSGLCNIHEVLVILARWHGQQWTSTWQINIYGWGPYTPKLPLVFLSDPFCFARV